MLSIDCKYINMDPKNEIKTLKSLKGELLFVQTSKENASFASGCVRDKQWRGSHTSQHSAPDIAISETCYRHPEGSCGALHFNTKW